MPVAASSKAWVCGRSFAGIVGSNSTGGQGRVSCECCQVEVSALGQSLVQRSPTECCREASLMGKPCPKRSCRPMEKNYQFYLYTIYYTIYYNTVLVSFRLYRVSQEEGTKLWESVPYVKIYRYNPKHLHPKLNSYGDNGQRKVWSSGGSTHCTLSADNVTHVCPPLPCQITEIPLTLQQ